MPVILGQEWRERWLDPRPAGPGELASLLKPYPAEEMAVSAVFPEGGLFGEPR
jgi:putative SOS response-associated peptidase YedK